MMEVSLTPGSFRGRLCFVRLLYPLGIFIRCGAWDIGTVSDLPGEVGSLAGK